jgi:hypothetical protein
MGLEPSPVAPRNTIALFAILIVVIFPKEPFTARRVRGRAAYR